MLNPLAGIAMGNVPMLIVHVLGKDRFTRGLALMWFLQFPALMGATPFTGRVVHPSLPSFLISLILSSVPVLLPTLSVCIPSVTGLGI